MEGLLLRTCSACLQELTDLKHSIQAVDARVQDLQQRVDHLGGGRAAADAGGSPEAGERLPGEPAAVPACARAEARSLRELCLLEDAGVRGIFADAGERGQLRLELRELLYMAREGRVGATEEALLREVLPGELRAGHLRAAVYRACAQAPLAVSHDLPGALAALEEVLHGNGSAQTVVVLAPVFDRGCWPLLEAALRWCERERVTPTLDLLHRAVTSVLRDTDTFRDVDLLGLFRGAPAGVEPAVATDDSGEMFLRWNNTAREEAVTEAEWMSIHSAVAACSSMLSALCGGRELRRPELLELLPALRVAPLADTLGLPHVLRTACGGALLRACSAKEMEVTQAAELPKVAESPKAPEAAAEVQPTLLLPGAAAASAAASTPAVCGAQLVGIEGAPRWHSVELEVNADGQGLPEEGALAAPVPGKAPSVVEQQAAFIECFINDLLKKRPLLLSQLNNLYKMRGGQELNYKLIGYEKLQDFLLDIPGLSLAGKGNRMQVQLNDASMLEAFKANLDRQRSWAAGAENKEGHTPQFTMPEVLPDHLLQKIYTVFMAVEGHEIALRNFLEVWKRFYPIDLFVYRALGFRDVRGLLSQVSFIQKIGGKSDTRYVLKRADVPRHLLQPLPGEDPISISMQDGAHFPRDCSIEQLREPCPPTLAVSRAAPAPTRPWGPPAAAPERPCPATLPRQPAPPCAAAAAAAASCATGAACAGPGPGGVVLPGACRGPEPDYGVPEPAWPGGRHGPGAGGSPWASPNSSMQGLEAWQGFSTSQLAAKALNASLTASAHAFGSAQGSSQGFAAGGHGFGSAQGVSSPAPLAQNNPAFVDCRREEMEAVCQNGRQELVQLPEQMVAGAGLAGACRRQLPRAKKGASFFVSSPGAFSSETRDASIHQGKFDMCSVLQMQLRQGLPCLVCDLSGGQVVVTNAECEDFFEATFASGQLVQSDVLSLIHEEDREHFSTCLTYLIVSERTSLEPQQVRIVTRTGRMHQVCIKGEQLIGMWWQLEIWLLNGQE